MADFARAPTIADLASAAADPLLDDVALDLRIAHWLAANGRLDLAEPCAAVAPGWCRAKAADGLLRDLLPGWELTGAPSATTITIAGPGPDGDTRTIAGTGPSFARAILAATFAALAEVGGDAPDAAAAEMAGLRDALLEELADG